MATLSRRTGARLQASIWPGFVDAMTGLLLVLMFVLTIFMVVQFVLRETISGQENELDSLSGELAQLAAALGVEQERGAALSSELLAMRATLQTTRNENDAQSRMIAQLEDRLLARQNELQAARGEIEDAQSRVAQLLAERSNLLTTREAQQKALSDAEAQILALSQNLAAAQDAAQRAVDAQSSAQAAQQLAEEKRALFAQMVAEMRAELAAAQDQNANLQNILAQNDKELDEATRVRLAEAAAAEALQARLSNADAELTAMSLVLEKERQEAEKLLSLLAAARAVEGNLNQKLAAALASEAKLTAAQERLEDSAAEREAQLRQEIAFLKADLAARTGEASGADELREALAVALAAKSLAENASLAAKSKAEQQAALLATAQATLSAEKEISSTAQRNVAVLNQQISALRTQLGDLQALLNDAQSREEAAQIQLQSLGQNLNVALAQVAAEERKRRKLEEAERLRLEKERAALQAETKDLQKYRSEFFGRLRDLLGGQEGVRIVGDRFVFASEVLFSLGSSELSPEGEAEIAKVARILATIADEIPKEIDWIIRVDGHTDNIPISNRRLFNDNWELSQARALSVVRFMVNELGLPPNRLSANGFGEFQPVDPANTPQARAQNRRIELKLTEK